MKSSVSRFIDEQVEKGESVTPELIAYANSEDHRLWYENQSFFGRLVHRLTCKAHQ